MTYRIEDMNTGACIGVVDAQCANNALNVWAAGEGYDDFKDYVDLLGHQARDARAYPIS